MTDRTNSIHGTAVSDFYGDADTRQRITEVFDETFGHPRRVRRSNFTATADEQAELNEVGIVTRDETERD